MPGDERAVDKVMIKVRRRYGPLAIGAAAFEAFFGGSAALRFAPDAWSEGLGNIFLTTERLWLPILSVVCFRVQAYCLHAETLEDGRKTRFAKSAV